MLRIGAVSYLNTRPLIYGLRGRLRGFGELSLNLPSRLATDLANGDLDVALVPSIEFFRGLDRGYRVISDAAIACRGPVWSVRLLSRVPISQIQCLALDEGSRASAAMLRVLLSQLYGIHPRTVPLQMEQDPESVIADAMLVIGDRAMHPPTGVYEEIWDLGERWCQWTGLPFVFAMWVARADFAETGLLKAAFQQARDEGVLKLEEIAQREAGPHGFTVPDLRRYFEENLHFRLGPRELDGLEMYRQKAAREGLLSTGESAARPTKMVSVSSGDGVV